MQSRSQRLFARAKEIIPGGVNSPVRAFAAVGGDPPFIERGEGAYLVDEDGMRYLDLIGSWGALLFGHAPKFVLEAIAEAAARGTSFGAPTEREILLAEKIRSFVPSMERVRLCSSGTEATMHAVRLSRGFTGRDLVVKFEGCYHGAHDSMLVAAGSGVATFAKPGSPGIPASVAANTLVLPFNDLDAAAAAFAAHGDQIASVIVEPVPGNMGLILPKDGYLQGLRDLCTKHGALLVFDEVMCGFRVGGTAQARYGVTPDLTCLGKIVGGGLPLAAFGGRREVMEKLSPLGPVYQAGTLSGNPVAVAAGLATLERIDDGVFARLEDIGRMLDTGLTEAVGYHGWSYVRVGAMFTVYARPELPTNFQEMKTCDMQAFGTFHRSCLDGGVYLPPAQYEAAFTNVALDDGHVDEIIEAIGAALVATEE